MPEYTVNFMWDAEAAVWVATSEDIPGLVLESGSLDALTERVRNAARELLELNGGIRDRKTVSMRMKRYTFSGLQHTA